MCGIFGIIDTDNSTTLTYGGLIYGPGSFGSGGWPKFTKAGSGNLTLSGANTYIGGTFITAGSLILGASGVLADTGGVVLSNVNGATLNLNDNDETIGGLDGGGTTGGNVVLGSGNLSINSVWRPNGSNLGFNGVISGTGGIRSIGTHSITLTNANNSYSGTTIINSGGINLKTNNGVLPDGTELTIRTNGFLKLHGGISQTVAKLVGTSSSTRISLHRNHYGNILTIFFDAKPFP